MGPQLNQMDLDPKMNSKQHSYTSMKFKKSLKKHCEQGLKCWNIDKMKCGFKVGTFQMCKYSKCNKPLWKSGLESNACSELRFEHSSLY